MDLHGARALFTTRRGGVSDGPYSTLNLGLWTDDDRERVLENRARAAAVAGTAPDRLAYGRQVHGATVRRLSEARPARSAPAEEDGQATCAPGVVALVLVADCLPIALAGDGAVAMLHGGWRGLAAGIVEEGMRALRELGGEGAVRAAIGPCARACCYEVSEEVHAAFAAFGDGPRRGSNLDLPAVARRQLLRAGAAEVHDAGLCTICSDPSLFFSHRRDGPRTGRQGGLVWRS